MVFLHFLNKTLEKHWLGPIRFRFVCLGFDEMKAELIEHNFAENLKRGAIAIIEAIICFRELVVEMHFDLFNFFVAFREDKLWVLAQPSVKLLYHIAFLKIGVFRIIEEIGGPVSFLSRFFKLQNKLSEVPNGW